MLRIINSHWQLVRRDKTQDLQQDLPAGRLTLKANRKLKPCKTFRICREGVASSENKETAFKNVLRLQGNEGEKGACKDGQVSRLQDSR